MVNIVKMGISAFDFNNEIIDSSGSRNKFAWSVQDIWSHTAKKLAWSHYTGFSGLSIQGVYQWIDKGLKKKS